MNDDLVKRYDLQQPTHHMGSAELVCDTYGDWVLYRDYKALADRIEELKAKLAKAVEALEGWINVYTHCTIEEGVCCCGDDMNSHTLPMDSNHMPLDHGAYIAGELAKQTEITLAELKGEK